MALKALRVNKLRSSLTMLGMIIGVAAVIAMLAIGGGAQERVRDQLKNLGSNLMLIIPGSTTASGVRLGTGAAQTLTEEDALAIALEVEGVVVAAPSMRGSGQVVVGNLNWSTQFFGTNNDYLIARDWPLASGRLFEPNEIAGSGKVALIGLTTAQQLFGDADPVDQVIRVRKVPLTIIGVLARKGQNALGQDQDDIVLMPISTARNRVLGQTQGKQRRVGTISVKTADGADMKAIEEKIKELLRQRMKVQPGADDPFTIRNLTEILQAQEAASRVLTLLLGAVASVSLLVGGIGIMNIMLVSVTERTREIGLRMAVGARGKDILKQFLVEAVTLVHDRRRTRHPARCRCFVRGRRIRQLAYRHHAAGGCAGRGLFGRGGRVLRLLSCPQGLAPAPDRGAALRIGGLAPRLFAGWPVVAAAAWSRPGPLTPGAAHPMPRPIRTLCLPPLALACLAVLACLLAWPGDAAALMRGIGLQPDARERLWLSAFSGFTLGLAIGLMVYEVRARGVSIALRRLTDLAASIDGRFPEETPRGKINRELERLSDEVLFSARRMTRERKEFDSQATAWQAMFAATLDAMFVLDAAGKVKELNPAAERQFNITAAEAVGSHLADLLFPLPHRALDMPRSCRTSRPAKRWAGARN